MTSALKDKLNPAAVHLLAEQVAQVFPEFDVRQFEHNALEILTDLSLTARVKLLQRLLIAGLSPDLRRDAARFSQLAAQWPTATDRGWECYAVWPLIEMLGECGRDDPATALQLLAEFTHLFTAEFAMRWYVRHRLSEIHPFLMQWTTSDSPHIRRLASECIRPRLPWGGHINALRAGPAPIWPVLEALKNDPSLYVQKSVGNNLNDISKDHPQWVLALSKRWLEEAPPSRRQIVRRALRTLIKAGEPAVFPLLGYTGRPLVSLELAATPARIAPGQTVNLALIVQSQAKASQRLNVDYRLIMPGQRGQKRDKVFKWQTLVLSPGETANLQKTQSFAQLSTRRYYPGQYTFEILINGVPEARANVQLTGA